MIQLLFALVFSEMALIVAFVFKTPLRKLVIISLDRVKRGRGPIVVKTVALTVLVVMLAAVYNVLAIRRRRIQEAEVNPTDQVLLAKQLLEASLMGFSLFLALMIDRLHHYIRELRIRRKMMEAVKKQNRVLEDGRNSISEEIKSLEEEMSKSHGRIKQLALMIDRLHHYIRELRIRRKMMEAVKKQNRVFEDGRNSISEEIKSLEEEMSKSHGRIKQLERELEYALESLNLCGPTPSAHTRAGA